MLKEQCAVLFSEYFSFWCHLSDSQKEIVYTNTEVVKYKKGTFLNSKTDNCVGVIFVKKGQLRTYMLSENGREITLFRSYENETCILSASCVLEAITFDVFINAEEDCEILLINSNVFHKLASENIYVEAFAYKLATSHFSDVMWAMQQILFMGADKRLAIFLTDEMARIKSDEFKLTHEQIAKYIGTAREVISRMLRYFASEGIVELSRGGIKVINKSKLKALI